jgi:diaminopimelate epimerase
MTLRFSKYHGTGNDFIIIDNRDGKFIPNTELIHFLCHRQSGIGADGLMTISSHNSLDFSMKYYNADGKEGSMCGNGGRCISAYHYKILPAKKNLHFLAIDGEHFSEILNTDKNETIVSLQLNNVEKVKRIGQDFLLDTGSPHYVRFVYHVASIDVKVSGRNIRYNKKIALDGVNVNFVEFQNDNLSVRTYERGVEDETLSCGTGVTASAIAASFIKDLSEFKISTTGGDLQVSFKKESNTFKNIRLTGPATFVFSGQIEI